MSEQEEGVFDWGGYPDLHEDWGGDAVDDDEQPPKGCAWFIGAFVATAIVVFMVLAIALGVAAALGIVLWVIHATWGAVLD